MKILYFHPEHSFRELKKALALFEAAGYDTDTVRIGQKAWSASRVPQNFAVAGACQPQTPPSGIWILGIVLLRL